jgi:hypothetical protein
MDLFILLICGLFNDNVSSSENGLVDNVFHGFGRKWMLPNVWSHHHLPGGREENH